jgi:hypothetical protein
MKEIHGHCVGPHPKYGPSGNRQTPEYKAWAQMKHRCTSPKNPCFGRYGGRGITFCERWGDFANFLADMGPRPSSKHSLDRIDNDRGYEPGNCEWRTRFEQMGNTRRNVYMTHNGETAHIAEWARRMGVGRHTLQCRLYSGWSTEKTLTTPVQARKTH